MKIILLANATNTLEGLEKHFPHHECALDICYPQYWLTDALEATYPLHIQY